MDLGDVSELLVEAGYERTEQVEDRGQFSIRGDILDVFGATSERPVRLELFGDEIESIRWFSTFTQRSLDEIEVIELDPAAELALEHRELAELSLDDPAVAEAKPSTSPDIASVLPIDRFVAPLDLIGEDTAVVLAAAEEIPSALADHWEDVTTAMHDADARHLYVDVADPLEKRAALHVRGLADDETADRRPQTAEFRAQAATSAARSIGEAESQLEKDLRSGYRIVVTFESRGEAERTLYNLNRVESHFLEGPLSDEAAVRLVEAPLSDGFVSPELRLVVIPFRRLVHRRRAAAPTPGGRGPMATFADLRVGDYVVHEDHGIARFAGFETKTLAGVTRDYLELEYKGDDKVFAPTEQLTKITRYVGSGGEAPQLSALGSKRWDAVKARARRAARELAGELLNLYAERQARKGHTFEPDGEWQLELERSFPYRETADQIDAIEAVKADMESDRPMDRLICGDVGYGKTEVALRAAHKAAAEGKQVMMLVPTTILAQQHLGTFRERLQISPLEIEMVSRLRKPAEVREALAKFAEGKVDILIGTHRLLSRDVRAKDLGLVIVDEEQRFGVKQKELLRQLKLKVDVLSLSATPIPRTLQMSLAGLRDISVIETPPEGRRPVRTYVGPYDEELVGRAIQREVAREGQVFFLHNRIDSLHDVAERLRAVCPGVRFAEAHGQMDEGELEETMLRFLRGDADCLVATTIIESGLDIPQANTLIVERADQLGLAQAYQIRGRVGRSQRARLRVHALPVGGGAQRRGGPASGDPLRLHGARLRLRDRDARPRAARRGRSAGRRAIRPRRGDRLRALRRAARRGGRGAARGGGDRGRGRGAGAAGPRRRRLPARRLRPVRDGEDRHPPPHRGHPRAGAPAPAARRAARPLRPGSGAGREPAGAAARQDRPRGRRGADRGGARRPPLDRAAGAGRGDRRAGARADPGGDVRAPLANALPARRQRAGRAARGAARADRRRSRRRCGRTRSRWARRI